MHLSDKARGKRRATFPNDIADASGSSSEVPSSPTTSNDPSSTAPTELTIRFTEGVEDITFSIDSSYTVKDVKILIREYRPTLTNRRLRLIHQGRILQDATLIQPYLTKNAPPSAHTPTSSNTPYSYPPYAERTTSSTGSIFSRRRSSEDEDTLPLISPSSPVFSNTGSNAAAIGGMATAWIHCAVGPVITPEEEGEIPEQTAQITPLRGFDRLLASGISEAEIANIRRQFHAESGLGGENLLEMEFADDAEYEAHARHLEETWLDSLSSPGPTFPSSTSLSTSTSTHASVTQGLFMGFFFPLLPFFFFRAPREPIFWENGHEADRPRSVVFSVRTQVAVGFGLAVNLIFGLYRMVVSGY